MNKGLIYFNSRHKVHDKKKAKKQPTETDIAMRVNVSRNEAKDTLNYRVRAMDRII